MKQSAMQELKEDLILTVDSADNALLEIENENIRKACQVVVKLTLKKIIKRIDDKLLEMEKQQIIDAHIHGCENMYSYTTGAEQYYNETFKNK